MKYLPRPYQDHATAHVIDNPASGLFLEMGLGKTVSTLTAIDKLMNQYLDVRKVLIIAPKNVAINVWSTEKDKWDHLRHLKLSIVVGDEKTRKRALRDKADIYITNRENVAWLVTFYGMSFPFDMLVIDELSSFKDPKSQRFKALRVIRPLIKRVVGLTGTPAPNGLLDLWPQLYLLDMGERLGKTLTSYREKYFKPGKRNGHVVYNYNLNKEAEDSILGADIYEKEIFDKISDICISMKSKDYLSLPERVDVTVDVNLSPGELMKYEEFEREQILAINDIDNISAINAAALCNKLLQFANGAVYDANKASHEVHKQKLHALEEIIDVANGHPVLIFYSFKHDLERMMEHLHKYKPVKLETTNDINRWNEGRISVMCAHPASAGHGLNLQEGGNIIVWFGMNWSLELYQQANARLHRQGQTKSVIVHHLIAKGTMDEDVMITLSGKANKQDALMNAVKARIAKYTNQEVM